MGQRFVRFCDRFGGYFRRQTRTVETAARHDLRGLLQAETKNRERREEVIPEADHPALQHRVSESAWAERAVLDPVAQDANRRLGGKPTAVCSSTRAGARSKECIRWDWGGHGAASWARWRMVRSGYLRRSAVGRRPRSSMNGSSYRKRGPRIRNAVRRRGYRPRTAASSASTTWPWR